MIATISAKPHESVRWGWLASTGAVWLVAAAFASFFWFGVNGGVHGIDSGAYWSAAQRSDLYIAPPGAVNAYLYPPPFATMIWPLAQLPRNLFISLWMLLEAGAFIWLLKPLGTRCGVPAFLMCVSEIAVGNIYSFVAVAVVLGTRRAAPWALPALTKMTPAVGVLWFAGRREWSACVRAVATAAAIAAVVFVVKPGQWEEWWRFVIRHRGTGSFFLPLRVLVAGAIAYYAGRSGRRWLLATAVLLATPMFEWMALTVLAALPRLCRGEEPTA